MKHGHSGIRLEEGIGVSRATLKANCTPSMDTCAESKLTGDSSSRNRIEKRSSLSKFSRSAFAKLVAAGLIGTRNLVWGGSLASLAMFRKPTKMLEHATESLFLYKVISDRRGLRQRFVFDVLPCDSVYNLQICNFHCEGGWMRATGSYSTDLISLCQLCHSISPRTIFEIGTLRGYTSLHVAMNTLPECKIFTLDLPANGGAKQVPKLRTTMMDDIHCGFDVDKYYFSGTPYESRITTLFGDSASFDFSAYHRSIDLFFIDGAHSYEYVRNDSENALRCVREGGVIVWHDFGRVGLNGVSRYLLELSERLTIYSVPGGSLAFAPVKKAV